MSNRHGFNTSDLPPGISYTLVYSRMSMGWSFERAISIPAKLVPHKKTFAERMEKYQAKREAIRLRNEQRTLAEKLAWNAKAKAEKIAAEKWRKAQVPPWEKPGYIRINPSGARPIMTEVKSRKQSISVADDTSPAHVRVLRAEFCAEFIKTGNINTDLMTKLKEYVSEKLEADRRAKAISAEPQAQDIRGGRTTVRHDGGGVDRQPHVVPAG